MINPFGTLTIIPQSKKESNKQCPTHFVSSCSRATINHVTKMKVFVHVGFMKILKGLVLRTRKTNKRRFLNNLSQTLYYKGLGWPHCSVKSRTKVKISPFPTKHKVDRLILSNHVRRWALLLKFRLVKVYVNLPYSHIIN